MVCWGMTSHDRTCLLWSLSDAFWGCFLDKWHERSGHWFLKLAVMQTGFCKGDRKRIAMTEFSTAQGKCRGCDYLWPLWDGSRRWQSHYTNPDLSCVLMASHEEAMEMVLQWIKQRWPFQYKNRNQSLEYTITQHQGRIFQTATYPRAVHSELKSQIWTTLAEIKSVSGSSLYNFQQHWC